MIIEVGTSDFRTQAGKVEGLFIEPVKEHFERLGDCLKENVAVSNYEGEIDIYYIPLKVIQDKVLPNWVRGCNSVGSIHPTVEDMGWSQYVVKDTVKVVRIASLIAKHGINQIDFLKIDTEGHDTIILNDFLDTVDIKPNKIQFEFNVLSNPKQVGDLINRLTDLGYNCRQVKHDIVCEL